MAETTLSQLIKGATPPDTKIPPPAPLPPLAPASSDAVAQIAKDKTSHTRSISSADSHLATLPSAPPQIYLNLLILEASLRAQYLHLLSRRRINTFFLLILGFWNLVFTWLLFFRPREDGTGLGGSVYWVVETTERLAFMGGLVTVLLVKATGQWDRGVRWPRRWLPTTNRGLRGFNLRIVVTRRNWWQEALGKVAFLVPFGLWRETGGSSWHLVEDEHGAITEEDTANGGDHIMLLLLPKNFSSEFRENWEAYRTEYWERENERRGHLRKKLKIRNRQKAREKGGWKWWTGFWRYELHSRQWKAHDLEKHPHHHRHHHHSLSEKDALAKASRRRSVLRDGSHSRQSSRGSTPQILEFDGAGDGKPLSERVRRGSSVSSTSSVRRSTRPSSRRADGMLNPLTMAEDEGGTTKEKRTRRKEKPSSRPTTPETEPNGFAKRVPMPA